MSEKGRVKWPGKHQPSVLEQMYAWTFEERSEAGYRGYPGSARSACAGHKKSEPDG